MIYCRIDRRRKFPATILLRALGYSTEELLKYFYNADTLLMPAKGVFEKVIDYSMIQGQRSTRDVKDPKTNEIIVRKNRKFTAISIKKMTEAGLKVLNIEPEQVEGLISAEDIVNEETGEVIVECNETLTIAKLEELRTLGFSKIKVLFIDGLNVGSYFSDTLKQDKISTKEEAIFEILSPHASG